VRRARLCVDSAERRLRGQPRGAALTLMANRGNAQRAMPSAGCYPMIDPTTLLRTGPMLCAAGGLLITAGTLLTIYESARRPQTINITREFEERIIASGRIVTLRVGGGRSGLVLVAIGAALLAVAAITMGPTGYGPAIVGSNPTGSTNSNRLTESIGLRM
jgi:hypothetical protein